MPSLVDSILATGERQRAASMQERQALMEALQRNREFVERVKAQREQSAMQRERMSLEEHQAEAEALARLKEREEGAGRFAQQMDQSDRQFQALRDERAAEHEQSAEQAAAALAQRAEEMRMHERVSRAGLGARTTREDREDAKLADFHAKALQISRGDEDAAAAMTDAHAKKYLPGAWKRMQEERSSLGMSGGEAPRGPRKLTKEEYDQLPPIGPGGKGEYDLSIAKADGAIIQPGKRDKNIARVTITREGPTKGMTGTWYEKDKRLVWDQRVTPPAQPPEPPPAARPAFVPLPGGGMAPVNPAAPGTMAPPVASMPIPWRVPVQLPTPNSQASTYLQRGAMRAMGFSDGLEIG